MYNEDCSFELERHFANLSRRYLELDDEIHSAFKAPRPDQEVVADLKRRMLTLKGEMAAMGEVPLHIGSPLDLPYRHTQEPCVSPLRPRNRAPGLVASRCAMASRSSNPQTLPVPSMTLDDGPCERAYRVMSLAESLAETAKFIARAVIERARGCRNGRALLPANNPLV